MNLQRLLMKVTIISILMLLFSPIISATPQREIVLTTHNLCPYGCFINENSGPATPLNFKGVGIDVVRCVFTKIHRPLKVVVLPWARAQHMVKHKQADGFFAASKNDVRDDFATISTTIAEQKWQWYLLKENSFSPDQTSFKEKARVAGFIGANMLKWMKNEDYEFITQTRDTEALLELLMKDRVDAVLANNHVMENLLEKHNLADRIKTYLNKDKPLGVYFSKDFLSEEPNFLQNFNSHVPSCRDSSTQVY